MAMLIVGIFALGLLRSIFGFGNKRTRQEERETLFDADNQDKQKIFDKSEGEYVEYEEIKDED
ncbi:MAG: DUF4834 family protein [Prevotellaceae bacterium]|nr:DUF4834 family protein [Prevotellaceae bacterium]